MGPTVLIVDDESAICDNLSAFLEDEGMAVHTAGSGEEALERVEAGLPAEICIMDLRLPGMNGTEAMAAIARVAPHIRFIIHTGSAHDSVLIELSRAGFGEIPVFKKPIGDMTALARAVTALRGAAA